MTFVLGLVLVAAVVWYVGRPVLGRPAPGPGPSGTPPPPAAPAPDARRELLLRQLSELEYDFRMGKLTREDYLRQRADLASRPHPSPGPGGIR